LSLLASSCELRHQIYWERALDQLLHLVGAEGAQTHVGAHGGQVEIDGEDESSGGQLGRFPLQELTVALHVLAELASCETNLLEVMVLCLLIKPKKPLESLDEGDGAGIVQGELESFENLLLQVDDVLLARAVLLGCGQKGKHAVEGGRDGLLKLGCHQHDCRTEQEQVGHGLALVKNDAEVAISETASQMSCLLLVLLLFAKVLHDCDQTFPVLIRKHANRLSLHVISNGKVLLAHTRVARLRVLCGKLSVSLWVVLQSIDVFKVDFWHVLLKFFHPAELHDLVRSHLEECNLFDLLVNG